MLPAKVIDLVMSNKLRQTEEFLPNMHENFKHRLMSSAAEPPVRIIDIHALK